MVMAEVRRPAETLQFADGRTTHSETTIERLHRNGLRNGAPTRCGLFASGPYKNSTHAAATDSGSRSAS